MSKEAYIKNLREMVDQIEAMPDFMELPKVDVKFYHPTSIGQLREVRRLMRSPKYNSYEMTNWVDCNCRDQIEVTVYGSPELLREAFEDVEIATHAMAGGEFLEQIGGVV